jgi:hypothetical protein
MTKGTIHECKNCGEQVIPERRSYRYAESGISNVILQGIEVADCQKCGNSDVIIPKMAKIHRAIAQALASSPARLTEEQLRFLRVLSVRLRKGPCVVGFTPGECE